MPRDREGQIRLFSGVLYLWFIEEPLHYDPPVTDFLLS